MPNRLAEYRDTRGLSDAQVADELSALLGKPIAAQGVVLWSKKAKPPKAWAQALGLAEEETVPPDQGTAWVAGDAEPPPIPLRDDHDPPLMPPGAHRLAQPAPQGGDFSLVRDRIAKAYGAIGAGVSMATRNDGFGAVTDAYSDDIAKAWVAAARENKQVAKIVAFMESGGPVGELVVCHIILVMGFVYVSGRAPALGAIYGGKFDRFHQAAAAQRIVEPVEFDLNANGVPYEAQQL